MTHKLIYQAPGYILTGRNSRHPITGRTLELFARYPQALHPRDQRLLQLTLPPESFKALARFIDEEELS